MIFFITKLQKILVLSNFNILLSKSQLWSEAIKKPNVDDWYKIIYYKLKGLDKKRTYNTVSKSQIEGRQILSLKWMFKYKFDINGIFLKYKTCICVQGNL